MIHDICHPGLSNFYQKNKKTDIGLLYNESPLENMHINKGIEILENENFNVFEYLNFSDFDIVKKRIIKGILMTDGSKHNNLIKEIENVIEKIQIKMKKLIDKFYNVFSNEKIKKNEIFNIQQLYLILFYMGIGSNPQSPFYFLYLFVLNIILTY